MQFQVWNRAHNALHSRNLTDSPSLCPLLPLTLPPRVAVCSWQLQDDHLHVCPEMQEVVQPWARWHPPVKTFHHLCYSEGIGWGTTAQSKGNYKFLLRKQSKTKAKHKQRWHLVLSLLNSTLELKVVSHSDGKLKKQKLITYMYYSWRI